MKKITSYTCVGYFSLTLILKENKEGDRGGKLPCIKVENQGTQFQPPLLNLEEQEECV